MLYLNAAETKLLLKIYWAGMLKDTQLAGWGQAKRSLDAMGLIEHTNKRNFITADGQEYVRMYLQSRKI